MMTVNEALKCYLSYDENNEYKAGLMKERVCHELYGADSTAEFLCFRGVVKGNMNNTVTPPGSVIRGCTRITRDCSDASMKDIMGDNCGTCATDLCNSSSTAAVSLGALVVATVVSVIA
eukprot:g3024.t1